MVNVASTKGVGGGGRDETRRGDGEVVPGEDKKSTLACLSAARAPTPLWTLCPHKLHRPHVSHPSPIILIIFLFPPPILF